MANPNTIQWFRAQDVSLDELAIRQEFDAYVYAGDWTNALRVLSNNAIKLNGKVYEASIVNTLIEGVLALENKYGIEVMKFLADSHTTYQDLIDSWVATGPWSETASYRPFNFATVDDAYYMAYGEPTVGVSPDTDLDNWLYLGLKGRKGADGVAVRLMFDWNELQTYPLNSLVAYDGQLWVATQVNSGVEPGTDPLYWAKFLDYVEGEIFVGMNDPGEDAHYDGAVWFKTDENPIDTTGSVSGTFMVFENGAWEKYYPQVLYKGLVGIDQFNPKKFYCEFTIKSSDWVNKVYTINYPWLQEDSVVFIYPNKPMVGEQVNLYNDIQVTFGTNQIFLTVTKDPTVDLNIRFTVQ